MRLEQNELRFKKRKRKFTQVDNEIVNNAELSWQAKGLMLYLISKPEGWQFYETDIEKRASNGKSSVRNIIKELLDAGYLERGERMRDDKGYLRGYVYSVVEYQLDDYDGKSYIRFSKVGKSKIGNSKVGLSKVGKSDTSNTKESSNTKSSSNTEKDNKTNSENQSLSSEIFKFYESEFGPLSNFIAEELGYMIEETNEELTLEALKLSVRANKRTIKYAAAITRNWRNENIQSLDDLRAAEKMKGRGRDGKNRNQTTIEYDDGVNF